MASTRAGRCGCGKPTSLEPRSSGLPERLAEIETPRDGTVDRRHGGARVDDQREVFVPVHADLGREPVATPVQRDRDARCSVRKIETLGSLKAVPHQAKRVAQVARGDDAGHQ